MKSEKEFAFTKEIISISDQSLKFLAYINDFLRQTNQEEIEDISYGMKDRKIVLRLFEYVMSLFIKISRRYNLILDQQTHANMFNKTLNHDSIKNNMILSNEELIINDGEILEQMVCVFDNILKNDVFMNTFNIKEKCVLYILNIYGELSFGSINGNKTWSKKFYDLLESLPLDLLLSTLIGLNNSKSPERMRCVICKELAKIPTKKDGITAIVEFMKMLPDENKITVNNLDKVVSIVTLIPKDIDKETYIKTIAPELLSMLDHSFEKSYLFQASGRIISILLLNYSEVVYNYIISKIIDPLHIPRQNQNEETIDISIKRIERIVIQPDSNIIVTIISPIFTILWAASCFSHKTHKYIWRDRINSLILSYIIVSDQFESVFKIIENFLYIGNNFSFTNGEYGGISIEINNLDIVLSIEDIDSRIENFNFLIEKLRDDYKLIENIFLKLLNYWLDKNKNLKQIQDPLNELSYLKILMFIQNNYLQEIKKNTEKIFQILMNVICNFNENYRLSQKDNFANSNLPSINNIQKLIKNNLNSEIIDEDVNIVMISLNILNVILIDSPKLSKKDVSILDTIHNELIYMAENSVEPLKGCAKDLNILVKSYLAFPVISDQNKNPLIEDLREKYNKAIRYIYDQLVPIRAQGILLLKEIIETKDPIIDVNEVLNILIGLLKDDDSYVYLNAISCLSSLANNHGNYIVKQLLNEYANISKYKLDERIRIGDVLYKIIQYLGKMINNKISDSIATTMFDILTCSTNDIRLRSSALNLLGAACNYSFYGMGQWCFRALESSIDILNFEKKEEHVMIRRGSEFIYF
ncbi:hypothetical protein PMAC_002052 [Pneumocystis sp. 'macacae']|nr:hypothetical protein PMAC_002052 [Pneumocystis sp. 'macacae']